MDSHLQAVFPLIDETRIAEIRNAEIGRFWICFVLAIRHGSIQATILSLFILLRAVFHGKHLMSQFQKPCGFFQAIKR